MGDSQPWCFKGKKQQKWLVACGAVNRTSGENEYIAYRPGW